MGVFFMPQFNCCGVNNYTDWYNIKAWPNKERVPQECCRVEKDECHVEGHPEDWYQKVSHAVRTDLSSKSVSSKSPTCVRSVFSGVAN